jgi:dihydrofolate synthase / folylpolyglutamate synthase
VSSDAFRRTLDRLYRLDVRRGWDLKLESVSATLERLGHPERRFPSLHVAGTNGKGSTAAMAAAVLSAAGRRAALYTSPHLVDFRERIRVGEEPIAPDEVVALVHEVEQAAAAAQVELTFFELTTVVAFLHFARARADVAVVEVGLGGRLDATNVLRPNAALVTTIGFDHERFLGDSITAIAGEKAGVFKSGVAAVIGRVGDEAASVLLGRAKEVGASPVHRLGIEFDIGAEAGRLAWRGASGRRIDGLRLALRGRHQRDNAAVALAGLEAAGWLAKIDDETVRLGLASVRWPGRLERIGARPAVILDGAHNPEGAAALVAELAAEAAERPVRLVFGVLADKRWQEMAEIIVPIARDVTVVPVVERRSSEPEVIAEAFRSRIPTAVAPSGREAVDRLLVEEADRDSIVLVCGSLFLVGEVRAHLVARGLAAPL